MKIAKDKKELVPAGISMGNGQSRQPRRFSGRELIRKRDAMISRWMSVAQEGWGDWHAWVRETTGVLLYTDQKKRK